MIRINNIKINENLTDEQLINKVLNKNKLKIEEIKNWYIYKKSIDARDKRNIYYNYTIDIELKNKNKENKYNVIKIEEMPIIEVKRKKDISPIIIGAGPAGIFAGLTLVNNGIRPIIIEQGKKIEERIEDVETFRKLGKLNEMSNVQFGEGGAGTFSDGKLNTGNSSIYSRKVLEEFVKYGAPEEILYTSKPHIGTDNLVNIIHNIREYIISRGGTFLFNEKVVDFNIENDEIKSVKCSSGKTIQTDALILAIGHSARSTFRKLLDLGIDMKPKNFAVGVRIEHLQSMINKSQYGEETKLDLPAADYKLVEHLENGRTCYTFCMCPGGIVMASSSEKDTIVTNGMSEFARDGKNANSAVLVNVTTDDFDKSTPLGGIYFQEQLENKAFKLGGSNYNAPIQRFEDFILNKKTVEYGKVKPTYMPGVTMSNLNEILPEFIAEGLKEGIKKMDKKIKGFADKDALLTGVETRTSSPVQIIRNQESLMSNIYGIYPCGEGAGYAGGIMTSAIDGIKCAIKLLEREN